MHFDTLLLMSGTAMKVIQLFVALSLLIVLHEFGHYFFARLFKTRVEKFYLFFDFLFPFSGLLNFALFKKVKGDTEYGIGWFPLGGYVKIAGMVDESMDKEQMALPPQPWEYRSKKAWQRLFIMLGGIIVNVVLAIVLYIAVFGIYGEEYLPMANARYGITADSTARSMGLQNGDKIISINDKPVVRFEQIKGMVVKSEGKSIKVERNGQMLDLPIKKGIVGTLATKKKKFVLPRFPLIVDSVIKGKTAEAMGMKKGDSIIAINGAPVLYFDEYEDAVKDLAGKPITISVVRNGQPAQLSTTMPQEKLLGFQRRTDLDYFFEMKKINYNPIEAIGRGFVYTFEKFSEYIESFGLLFTSKEIKVNESMGGIISFGQIFPAEFDMEQFLMLTAFVSVILAFMNLLPIPGLDGGYVIFLLWEMITGKQVSEKVMERATTVGLVLLLTLMVYANGLDIFRLFKG